MAIFMYSWEDLNFLMDQAKDFDVCEYMPITWFYRDVKKSHYDRAMDKGRTTVALIDHKGDSQSPIDGRIMGTNFRVNVSFVTGEPMPAFNEDDWRIKFRANDIYRTCPNLYFADYYCDLRGGGHHVTLVMTSDNSSWDRFCNKRLPVLNPEDNPFLIFPDPYGYSEGEMAKVLSNGLKVEVIVTENLFLTGSDDVEEVNWCDPYNEPDPACPNCGASYSSSPAESVVNQPLEIHSKPDLRLLMDKAIGFAHLGQMPFVWFYRDMRKQHFEQVMNKGKITVCLKDDNGDPKSPINGRIQGINFQVNVDFVSGQPKTPSIYGDRRIKISASDIFTTCPNLYFADFYCYGRGSGHHVTLVMTEDYSNWDVFCRKRLLKLDPTRNPFLRFPGPTAQSSESAMVLSNGIWMEVVVTQNIVLTDADVVENVKWSDRYRNIMPRDKDPNCPDCNIFSLF